MEWQVACLNKNGKSFLNSKGSLRMTRAATSRSKWESEIDKSKEQKEKLFKSPQRKRFIFFPSNHRAICNLSTFVRILFFNIIRNKSTFLSFHILLTLLFTLDTSASTLKHTQAPQPLSHLRCNLGSLATSKRFSASASVPPQPLSLALPAPTSSHYPLQFSIPRPPQTPSPLHLHSSISFDTPLQLCKRGMQHLVWSHWLYSRISLWGCR